MTHIYYLDVSMPGYSDEEKESFLEKLKPRLHPERRKKLEQIRFLNDRLCSAGAGILFAAGLAEAGVHADDIRIGYRGNRKPYLPDVPDVHFNLSHSGERVMAVFSDHEVGCDIERVVKARMRVARRFFHKDEQAMLDQLIASGRENEASELFYRYWTLKESVLKVTGEGIRLPMNAFCILTEPTVQVRMEPGTGSLISGQSFTFLEHSLPGYSSCVCVNGNPGDVFFSFQNLWDVV